jgi:hypothetical protein
MILGKWRIGIIFIGPVLAIIAMVLSAIYLKLAIMESMLIGIIVGLGSAVIIKHFLDSAFNKILEGKGIGCFVLDSSGVLVPLVAKFERPNVSTSFMGKKIETLFDRKMVFPLAQPIKSRYQEFVAADGNTYCAFVTKKENLIAEKFSFFQIPFFLYNSISDSFYTKDGLADRESEDDVLHALLFQNRRLEEFLSAQREQLRFLAEQYKPKAPFGIPTNVLIILGIIILVGALLYFGWPTISNMLGMGAKAAEPLAMASANAGVPTSP